MHTRIAILLGLLLAAGCAPRADDAYARIENPPLVQGRLHTVTVAGAGAGFADELAALGYQPIGLSPNYPAAVRIEALAWDVSEEAAAAARYFQAPPGAGPNLRVLDLAPSAQPAPASPAVALENTFFRNVLGVEVPAAPRLENAGRVLAWTYLVDDVVAARKRLRTAGIPVTFDAVGITSAYFGDQSLMGIRAPDGTIVELVQTAAR